MFDIESEARARFNAVLDERGELTYEDAASRADYSEIEAMCRLMEEFDVFKREVSDVCEGLLNCTNVNKRYGASLVLNRFILPKPVDPVAAALCDLEDGRAGATAESKAACFRGALAARGLQIVPMSHTNNEENKHA